MVVVGFTVGFDDMVGGTLDNLLGSGDALGNVLSIRPGIRFLDFLVLLAFLLVLLLSSLFPFVSLASQAVANIPNARSIAEYNLI